jgi:hypothetical protein
MSYDPYNVTIPTAEYERLNKALRDRVLADAVVIVLLEALKFWRDYKGDNLDCEFEPICLEAIKFAEDNSDA